MNFKDRVSTYPNRYVVTAKDGSESYIVLERADEPIEPGTPLNAETFNEMFEDVKQYASDTINDVVVANRLTDKIGGKALYVGEGNYTYKPNGWMPDFFILHLEFAESDHTATVLTAALPDNQEVTYPIAVYVAVEQEIVTCNLVVKKTTAGISFTAEAGTIHYIAAYG